MLFGERYRVGWIGLCALLLSACTVVDLDENGKPIIPVDPTSTPGYSAMTPENIATALWQPTLLPTAQQQALSWDDVRKMQATLEGAARKAVYARLQGPIGGIDRESREGKLVLNVKGDTVTLQLGPIVKGNAIRDAAGFIRFDDFKNQVQFAQLARALNSKAIASLPELDASVQGKTVNVLAALVVTKQGISDAVPMTLNLTEMSSGGTQ
ncbi:DUF2291 domain-containing protein [Pectobacterium parmentieri]|uniref:DUF2291 domain-containing protein n=1 Tax=Pectobacterium parmentieri TaxID=1905730 RepID=A0ABS0RTF9_PECPM|nr:DUF2291 domain-containing protein [Pectobacterium parmentieri]AYH01829.1 hypothetical protein C5E26_13260 [Pectobacterium parmentieri]AYH28096.1 hypothetical protein C5E20_13665 [Pectobacterium parmentieri]AYH32400.1 hypothetical protein C5E19_12690 [Pectobacterium parmentieri]MBI0470516.1 DUF2291 domain-containing protein [Pectobacterium parmentieri]MBI0493116.1 DUF2291 domain-containing protein [Pectobacterium parmentieri]